jgi:hypothetical protein
LFENRVPQPPSNHFQTKSNYFFGLYFDLSIINCASEIVISCSIEVVGFFSINALTICQPSQLAVRPGASSGIPGEFGLGSTNFR